MAVAGQHWQSTEPRENGRLRSVLDNWTQPRPHMSSFTFSFVAARKIGVVEMRWIALALAGLAVLALLYAHWPNDELPPSTQVDSVLVLKAKRKLILMSAGAPIKEYRISLGGNPEGHKEQQGDSRTPEGMYSIDYRNPYSSFHRALHISYPNATDEANAAARGVNSGGLIMIHGTRNGLRMIGRFHRLVDWTDGCIAVTNKEIEEIWRLVPNGTPIEIRS
jgi:hypothetical protein